MALEKAEMGSSQAGIELGSFSGALALVGAGKMGVAMLSGWLQLGLDPARVIVVEPQPAPEIEGLQARGLRIHASLPAGFAAEAIIVAVKPQIAGDVLAAVRRAGTGQALILSIMAGCTLKFLSGALGSDTPIVRAMPNTPAAIGRGITVAASNAAVCPAQRGLAHTLLSAVGAVEWVEDEALLDPVTAVSGSGPAYVFLLAECLAEAGIAAGLPAGLAAKLARETVAGAGELLHRSELDPGTLRTNVTSPGGTTVAALHVLMRANGLSSLMKEAVAAATRRSRELGE